MTIRVNTALRHPGIAGALEDLRSEHLPASLREIARPLEDVAHEIAAKLADGPRLTTALNLIVQAKDAAVRQRVVDLKAANEPAPVNNPEPELR